jgi:excisionase family DNA binding protein
MKRNAQEAPAQAPQLLKVPEVCGRLAASRNTVYRLMESGELPYVLVRGGRRVREDDLAAYVERQTRR